MSQRTQALPTKLALEFAPTLDDACAAGATISELLARHYGVPGFCAAVELAITELLTNVVRHGTPRGPIRLSACCTRRGVSIAVADDGAKYDMSQKPHSLPADPLSEHGRGLSIIHATVDRFRYRRHDSLNIHRLTKLVDARVNREP